MSVYDLCHNMCVCACTWVCVCVCMCVNAEQAICCGQIPVVVWPPAVFTSVPLAFVICELKCFCKQKHM